MAFKVLIGKQPRGGNTAQEEVAVQLAALDLEAQLNAGNVKSVQGIFVNEANPLYVEIIAVAEVTDVSMTPAPKKGKGE